MDECGVPNGDNSSCTDCAGVLNGASEDLGCGCNNPAAQPGFDCDGNQTLFDDDALIDEVVQYVGLPAGLFTCATLVEELIVLYGINNPCEVPLDYLLGDVPYLEIGGTPLGNYCQATCYDLGY